MLEQIFMTIFVTSCIGAVHALLLTVLRPITRKCFSSRWHYYIWLVVLTVMIIPVSFKMPDDTRRSEMISEILETEVPDVSRSVEKIDRDFSYKIELPTGMVHNSVETVKNIAVSKMNVISGVWIVTALILLVTRMLRYALFLRKIRRDTAIISCPELKKFTDSKILVRMSSNICSPLMVGIIKPTLILPEEALSDRHLDNVLAHEVTHFKRKDVWYKWLVNIVKCIHWFNPAIYFIEKQIDMECEISCDLEVVKEMSREEEICYINTILSLLSLRKAKNLPLTTGMASNKETLKRRFAMIKNKKKTSRIAAVIAVAAAIVIFAGAIIVSGVLNGKYSQVSDTETPVVAVDEETGDKSNLLFIGTGDGKVDMMLLLSFDKEEKRIWGTSIPADTVLEKDEEKRTVTDLLLEENPEQSIIDAVRKEYSVSVNYYVMTDMNTLTALADGMSEIIFGDSYREMQNTIVQAFIYSHVKDADGSEMELVKERIKQGLTKGNIMKATALYTSLSKKIKTNCTIADVSGNAAEWKDMDISFSDIYLISGDYEEYENGIFQVYGVKSRDYVLQQMK